MGYTTQRVIPTVAADGGLGARWESAQYGYGRDDGPLWTDAVHVLGADQYWFAFHEEMDLAGRTRGDDSQEERKRRMLDSWMRITSGHPSPEFRAAANEFVTAKEDAVAITALRSLYEIAGDVSVIRGALYLRRLPYRMDAEGNFIFASPLTSSR
jgi:hypothetical protein